MHTSEAASRSGTNAQPNELQNGSVAKPGVNEAGPKADLMDGNESEDSAMLESPVSDKEEDKPSFA